MAILVQQSFCALPNNNGKLAACASLGAMVYGTWGTLWTHPIGCADGRFFIRPPIVQPASLLFVDFCFAGPREPVLALIEPGGTIVAYDVHVAKPMEVLKQGSHIPTLHVEQGKQVSSSPSGDCLGVRTGEGTVFLFRFASVSNKWPPAATHCVSLGTLFHASTALRFTPCGRGIVGVAPNLRALHVHWITDPTEPSKSSEPISKLVCSTDSTILDFHMDDVGYFIVDFGKRMRIVDSAGRPVPTTGTPLHDMEAGVRALTHVPGLGTLALCTQVTIDGYTSRVDGDINICVYRPRYGTLTTVLCVSQEAILQMACMSPLRVAWMTTCYMASLHRRAFF